MTLTMILTLGLAVLCGGSPTRSLDLPQLARPGRQLVRSVSPVLAQVRRNPMMLKRIVDRAHRMPKHTKVVIGLCTAGIVVFFIGAWAKSRL